MNYRTPSIVEKVTSNIGNNIYNEVGYKTWTAVHPNFYTSHLVFQNIFNNILAQVKKDVS